MTIKLSSKGVGNPQSQEFTSSNTLIIPSAVEWMTVANLTAAGASGAGGDSDGAFAGGGGGGGGQIINRIIKVVPGDTLTITIPAAASGGAADANGNDGSDATITGTGVSVIALGGKKGLLADGSDGEGGNGGGIAYYHVKSGTPKPTDQLFEGAIAGACGGKSDQLITVTNGAGSIPGRGTGGASAATAGGGGGGSKGDGADGNAGATGDSAGANTGGGGAGGGDNGAFAGGNSGSGYCLLVWNE